MSQIYTVKKGETLQQIAAGLLGDARYATAILRANPGLTGATWKEGYRLNIPSGQVGVGEDCRTDMDCTGGQACMSGVCGIPWTPEEYQKQTCLAAGGTWNASTGTCTGGQVQTCRADGVVCTKADQCCSKACTAGKCGAGGGPVVPACIVEGKAVGSGTCCAGLSPDTSGICRPAPPPSTKKDDDTVWWLLGGVALGAVVVGGVLMASGDSKKGRRGR